MLKELAPNIDLADHLIRNLTDDVTEGKTYLSDGFDMLGFVNLTKPIAEVKTTPKPLPEMDRSLPMLVQKEVLSISDIQTTGDSAGKTTDKDATTIINNSESSEMINVTIPDKDPLEAKVLALTGATTFDPIKLTALRQALQEKGRLQEFLETGNWSILVER